MIVGTAGHVDHGKTTLVKALTGVDTDRLPEEKKRGISLELGFAQWVLPSGRAVSVVDVPGHERLVKAMVGGAGGMQLALLVIAADEGVKPQTREHLEVCRLLGVPRGLVVLTRIDLAPVARREEVLAQVEALTAGSVFAAEAPCLVSAVTGEGLLALGERVDRIAGSLERADEEAPLLVPIDRAFTLKGFGVVVTGTVWSGALGAGESVALLPGGVEHRVRSMHVHGVAVTAVRAGQRVAVNLPEVTLEEVSRGQALARPNELGAAKVMEVELTVLGSASGLAKRSVLQLLVGTAQVEVTVQLIGVEQLEPGKSSMARVTAVREVAVAPGMRFVVRAGQTIGGGRVVAIRVPRRRARLNGDFPSPRPSPPRERGVVDAVEDAGSTGVSIDAVPALLGTSIAQATRAIEAAERAGLISRTGDGHLVSTALIERLASRATTGPTAAGTAALITRLVEAKKKPAAIPLSARGKTMLAELEKRGLNPPATAEWLSRLGTDERGLQATAKEVIDAGLALRAGTLFFAKTALDALEAKVRAHFATHPTLDTPTFKGLCGDLSRKFVIPLAEHFDAQRVTLRVGEHRVLRTSRP